jgi:hypothetical protein
MGVTRYKKTVECECGCNYGSPCGRKIAYLFCYNRSVDIGSLYIKDHAEKEESKYQYIKSMDDNEISALIEVLTANDTIEEITDEERKLI